MSLVDPDGLMEFSVVFTDRSLNHMSRAFQGVMRDISGLLKEVYAADHVAIVPGGGTFAMEAVARQLGTGAHAFVLRNGWFSYRWSQIFDAGQFAAEVSVNKARRTGNAPDAPVAPHVETSAGIILPDDYIRTIADAAHEVGAVLVLDCVASGCIWVDMRATGVDVLISAPQKGWSSTPAAGLVMLSERGRERVEATTSNSFALDQKNWLSIMKTYEGGGHAYHTTLPTDSLRAFRDAMIETRAMGFEAAKAAQWALGRAIRARLAGKGIRSVAAPGFEAPGVVVSYTADPEIQNGRKFMAEGMQIAAGVPLQCDEGPDFRTFRLGLFGLDKLRDVEATVARFGEVLDRVA